MKCLICGFECEATAKFCPDCGAQRLKCCPSCAHYSSVDAHFCSNCGHKLPTIPPQVHAGPASHAEPVSQTTFPIKLSSEGERRHATVLRADLSGYTALTESLDPEQVQEIIDRIKEIATQVIAGLSGL